MFQNTQSKFHGIDLSFVNFFFVIAIDSLLSAAAVVNGYGEPTGVLMPALDHAMLKS